jgi:hypothetical protein
VNLRRGAMRLAMGLIGLWLLFWTCAYVLAPRTTEEDEMPPALTGRTEIAMAAALLLGLPWVVSGFRPN